MILRLRAPVLLAALTVAAPGCQDEPAAPQRPVAIEIDRPSQVGDRGSGAPAEDTQAPPPVPGAERCDGARTPTTGDNTRAAEIAIRCLTNAVRGEKGLPELEFDERLARAAATRSADMAEKDYFSHRGPDGSDVRRAVRGTGYVPDEKSWLLGENIAWAPGDQATPAAIMRSWLDSPTHRANILSDAFREIGVGAVAAVPKPGADAGATYTQIFGVTGSRARRAQTQSSR